jgi:S-adenosylmethionine:tRNA ribosyltransferase-isomerase
MEIKISDYVFDLPEDRIAIYPTEPRDHSKLLVCKNGNISHHSFYQISDLLPQNTHLVLNNTKVIPARLFFKRDTGAIIEVFLLNPVLPSSIISQAMEATEVAVWECVIGNKKKWKNGEILTSILEIENKALALKAEIVDRENNHVKLQWPFGIVFSKLVETFGKIPLPPYLNRSSEVSDLNNYQTVYSENKGAVAAPTAGLHFTEQVFETIAAKGIIKSFLTLHVGAGTFMPVKTENVLEHPMHNEQMVFTLDFIQKLVDNLEFVVAVGTTSMRSLESLYWYGVKLIENPKSSFFIEKLFPFQQRKEIATKEALFAVISHLEISNLDKIVGHTEIMIFPGYKFQICKALITNFHQPASTLIMLVATFIGEKKWRDIYQEAMENEYRFLSFGDSSLLIP